MCPTAASGRTDGIVAADTSDKPCVSSPSPCLTAYTLTTRPVAQ